MPSKTLFIVTTTILLLFICFFSCAIKAEEQEMQSDDQKEEETAKTKTSQKLFQLPFYPKDDTTFCDTGKDSINNNDNNNNKNPTATKTDYERSFLKPGCGRFIVDNFLEEEEIDRLKEFAMFGMHLGGGSASGVTLVDFFSAVVSHETRFANLSHIVERHQSKVRAAKTNKMLAPKTDLSDIFPVEGFKVWIKAIQKLRRLVDDTFSVSSDHNEKCPTLRLALPAFFSRIDSAKAKSMNDEYWHSHVDTDQYGSFDITTLLYLSNQQEQFGTDKKAFGEFLNSGGSGEAGGKRKSIDPLEEEKRSKKLRDQDVDVEDEEDKLNYRTENNFIGGSFQFLNENSDQQKSVSTICSIRDKANKLYISGSSENGFEDQIFDLEKESRERIAGLKCDKLIIHPKKGRVFFFSSGKEHPHRVEKVVDGVRWTSTNAFTCDRTGKSVDITSNIFDDPENGEFPPRWLMDLATGGAK